MKLPREVERSLGWYVYLYVDPRNASIFYVGKGKHGRVLAHLGEEGEKRKHTTIREITEAGLEPQLEVLSHGLRDEEMTFRVEAAAIDLLGLKDLCNEVRGWQSIQFGRMGLKQLTGYYAATPIEITDPVVLIRISQLYRHNMSPHELYEATRGFWKMGPRRTGARYALAVFEGVAREAYQIEAWHRAGATSYSTRDSSQPGNGPRWEFTGRAALEEIRTKYVDKSVARYLPPKGRASFAYVNC